MNFEPMETSRKVKFGLALILVALCLGIDFRRTQDRALARLADLTNGTFLVVDKVDAIVDGLDRLTLNQRDFIYTRDLRFSQDLYESLTAVQTGMDCLRNVARKDLLLRQSIARLDKAINSELELLRNANELDKSKGPAEAVALLDNNETIEQARTEAEHLRLLAVQRALNRIRSERKLKSILDLLL